MPIRAVIFDFGGVLVRLDDLSRRQMWEERLDLPEGELAKLVFESEVTHRSMVGKATEADVWEHVAGQVGLDPQQVLVLRRDFWAGERLDTELVSFLRHLRRHYITAILSNAWPGSRELFTRRFGLGDVVDEIIISAEEGVAKPHAVIYQIAIDRLNVQPDEAIFVDDVESNVRAADAFGMHSFQFTSTQATIARVSEHLSRL